MMNIVNMVDKLTVNDLPEWARKPGKCGSINLAATYALAGKRMKIVYDTEDVDYRWDDREITVQLMFNALGFDKRAQRVILKTYVRGYCHKHNEVRTYCCNDLKLQRNDQGKMVALVEAKPARKARKVACKA